MATYHGRVASRDPFELLVEQAIALVPARYRERMHNVAIVVEDEPPRPGLLGLYEGRPLTERSVSEGFSFPDKISIYRGPHLRAARNREHLRAMVHETVWHEIGHYFGMDEPAVQRAEIMRLRARQERLRRRRFQR